MACIGWLRAKKFHPSGIMARKNVQKNKFSCEHMSSRRVPLMAAAV
jgi:hypothetical protein